jgi:hypothetical protein
VAALVLAVLGALLIVVMGRHGHALATPASIQGMPRMQGAAAEAFAEQARVRAGQDAQDLLVGVYGQNLVPAFMLMVQGSRDAAPERFGRSFIRGLRSGVSSAAVERHTQDGVHYDCGIVRTATTIPISFCFFDDGSATGAGLVPDAASIDRALQLTRSGRLAAER